MDSLFPKVGHYTQMIWSIQRKLALEKPDLNQAKFTLLLDIIPQGMYLVKPLISTILIMIDCRSDDSNLYYVIKYFISIFKSKKNYNV